jgi:O-antigen/teichoic acid export membrane protein
MFVLVAVCAAFNILLNFIFVPIYGYTAAAWTTVAGYLLYPVLVHRASRAHVPWLVPWRTIMVALGAGLVAAAAGYAVRRALIGSHPLVINTVTGLTTLAVYAGLAALAIRNDRARTERSA